MSKSDVNKEKKFVKKGSKGKKIPKPNPNPNEEQGGDEQEEQKLPRNDFSWISKDNDQSLLVGQVSWGQQYGRQWFTDRDFPATIEGAVGGTRSFFAPNTMPGIITMNLYMGPGYTSQHLDPVDVAATNMWEQMRQRISGSTRQYSPNDIICLFTAIDSAMIMYNHIKRFYGIRSKYSTSNIYTPKAFFIAAGVDYDNFINYDAAQGLVRLNEYASMMADWMVPVGLDILMRHSTMMSNIWCDENSYKTQYYWFIPDGYYTLQDGGTTTFGTSCAYNFLPNHSSGYPQQTVSDLLDHLRDQIEAIRNFSYTATIMADLRKTFGDRGVLTVSSFDLKFQMNYGVEDSWLREIHNADILGYWNESERQNSEIYDRFAITQDPNDGLVNCTPIFPVNNSQWWAGNYSPSEMTDVINLKKILSLKEADSSVENVLEACQLKVTKVSSGEIPGVEGSHYIIPNWQSEVVSGAWMTTAEYSSTALTTGPVVFANSRPFSTFALLPAIKADDVATIRENKFNELFNRMLCNEELREFRYSPTCLQFSYAEGDTVVKYCGKYGDVDNFTFVEADAIDRMHRVATFSLWDMNGEGTLVKAK